MQGNPAQHQRADVNLAEIPFSAEGNVKSLVSDSAQCRAGILL